MTISRTPSVVRATRGDAWVSARVRSAKAINRRGGASSSALHPYRTHNSARYETKPRTIDSTPRVCSTTPTTLKDNGPSLYGSYHDCTQPRFVFPYLSRAEIATLGLRIGWWPIESNWQGKRYRRWMRESQPQSVVLFGLPADDSRNGRGDSAHTVGGVATRCEASLRLAELV
jgi:hypothetical protein